MKSKAAILAALFAFAAFATATIGGFADTPALQNYGSLTSTGSVGVRNLTNQSTCTTTVSGGATKTITFEGEGNGPSTGSSYIALPDTGTYSALNTTTFQGSTPATTATADGLYVTPVAGLTGFRARVSSYGSGTVNITVFCTAGVLASTSTSSGGGGGSGATPIPYASDGNGVMYSHPTGVPTFAPAPTPIPTPAGGVYPISGAPTPIPTPTGGIYPISGAPTPIPTPTGGVYPISAPYSGTTNQTLSLASFLGSGCVASASPGTLTTGTFQPCFEDLAGNAYVNLATALPSGSNTIGTVNAGSGFPTPAPVPLASPGATASPNAAVLTQGAPGGYPLGVNQAGTYGQCSLSALNAACIIPLGGGGGVSYTISGTWTATLSFKGSSDEAYLGPGSATFPWTLTTYTSATTNSSSTTANGTFAGGFPAFAAVEVIATAYTSGTAVVTWHTSTAQPNVLQGYAGQNVGAGSPSNGLSNTSSGLQVVGFNECFAVGQSHFDACVKDSYTLGPQWMTIGGYTNTATAAGTAGPTVLKASAGRISHVLITAAGTTSETWYDNASACSGTIIAETPATTSVGQIIVFDTAALNGITACGASGTSPGITTSLY
jgi:hypothetical protein